MPAGPTTKAKPPPTHTCSSPVQDVIEGYLKPLQAMDWDRGALLNLRAFSIPPAYDYASLAQPVLLVQASGLLSAALTGVQGEDNQSRC